MLYLLFSLIKIKRGCVYIIIIFIVEFCGFVLFCFEYRDVKNLAQDHTINSIRDLNLGSGTDVLSS